MNKLDKIWDALTQRFSNPTLIAFGLSWLVINYKLLLVLTSSDPYTKKFEFIENVLYAPATNPNARLYWFPALCAIAYIVIVPGLTWCSTAVSAWWDNCTHWLDLWIRRKAILSAEQATALKQETAALVAAGSTELASIQKLGDASAANFKWAFAGALLAIRTSLLDSMEKELAHSDGWGAPVIRSRHPAQPGPIEWADVIEGRRLTLLIKYGVPEEWMEPCKTLAYHLPFTVRDWAGKGVEDLEPAWLTLLRLHTLNLVDIEWAGSVLLFKSRPMDGNEIWQQVTERARKEVTA